MDTTQTMQIAYLVVAGVCIYGFSTGRHRLALVAAVLCAFIVVGGVVNAIHNTKELQHGPTENLPGQLRN